jgi:hypothetical protein
MKQKVIDVSWEKLLSKLDEILYLARQINKESAQFHAGHNHKRQRKEL